MTQPSIAKQLLDVCQDALFEHKSQEMVQDISRRTISAFMEAGILGQYGFMLSAQEENILLDSVRETAVELVQGGFFPMAEALLALIGEVPDESAERAATDERITRLEERIASMEDHIAALSRGVPQSGPGDMTVWPPEPEDQGDGHNS